MAPSSASYDDPSSFLFGLNHFSSPGMAAHDGGSYGGVGRDAGSGSNSHDREADSAQNNSNLLAGLEAFSNAPPRGHGENPNDLLEGGSFADELALWTNANFSFDGPTGHALLGDEEKDKDKDKGKEDKDAEDRRAGKRVRNDNKGDDGDRPLARNGKNRLHDDDAGHAGAAEMPQQQQQHHHHHHPQEPTHQAHRDQAAFQQQQNYFAPPSSRAEEARRPGFAGTPQHNVQTPSAHVSPAPSGVAGPQPPHLQQAHAQGQGQQQSPFPFASPYGGNGGAAAAAPAPAAQQHAFYGQPQGPQQGPPQGNGQVDLTSLLAIQQLLASNPLALATLGSFSGLNPQLGLLGNQLSQMGGQNGQAIQQLQQQLMQQQAQRGQQPPMAAQPPHQQQQHPQQQHPQSAEHPPFIAGGGPFGFPQHGPQQPAFNGPNGPLAGAFGGGMPNGPNGHVAGPPFGAGHDSVPLGNGAHHESRSRASSMEDLSNDKKAKSSSGDEQGAADDERDGIPPLQLIDTGNPVADAEANRVAIEEDKRRRNTAASARFRVKKKQREAALEAHTKELEDQVSDLRDELDKLRNENQWLKGLIQVRAGPEATPGTSSSTQNGSSATIKGAPVAPSMTTSDALQAAQQLQAIQQAFSSQHQHQHAASNGTGNTHAADDRSRHTGIHPRGVGTTEAPSKVGAPSNPAQGDDSAAGQKRDRSD